MSSSSPTANGPVASSATALWDDEAFCSAFAGIVIAEPAPAPEPEEEYEYEGHFSTRDLKYMYTQAVLKAQPDFAAALLKRYGEHLADSPALVARELFFPLLPESEGMSRILVEYAVEHWEVLQLTAEFAEMRRRVAEREPFGGQALRLFLPALMLRVERRDGWTG